MFRAFQAWSSPPARRSWFAVAAVAAAAALLAGCSGGISVGDLFSGSSPGTAPQPGSSIGGSQVKVGLVLPLSGSGNAAVAAQVHGQELAPTLDIDAEVAFADLAPPFLRHYSAMEPFGMGNEEPVFMARGVTPQLPGNIIKERHWKLLLRQGAEMRPAMWFNAPVKSPPPAPWDVAFKVQRHFWRGQESWQLMICGVQEAEQ